MYMYVCKGNGASVDSHGYQGFQNIFDYGQISLGTEDKGNKANCFLQIVFFKYSEPRLHYLDYDDFYPLWTEINIEHII